jgi:hypothetical protein
MYFTSATLAQHCGAEAKCRANSGSLRSPAKDVCDGTEARSSPASIRNFFLNSVGVSGPIAESAMLLEPLTSSIRVQSGERRKASFMMMKASLLLSCATFGRLKKLSAHLPRTFCLQPCTIQPCMIHPFIHPSMIHPYLPYYFLQEAIRSA